MTLRDSEFGILRDTIARRGTMRHALVPATLVGWGIVSALLLPFRPAPATSLVSLAVLVAGFEAVHALHVGVERVGRYLQVFYEGGSDGPQWESAAMRFGPGLPGGAIDSLFTAVFVSAALVNLALLATPFRSWWGAIAASAHALFVIRALRARHAATGQRAVDLETFTAIRAQLSRNAQGGGQGPAAG
jgi:hypothetical protein